ncbi:SDR family oxidoreductase [Sphingobium rhizovicinum]|uniref:SDR family oxidoreductase n=1 Tax=Sphingobium rhizovicinum TaxID=432308 RepID=A0ABV7NBZ4_9SPHN
MRVLLIGAYGFIGSGVARALMAAGHEVRGVGRSRRAALRIFPDLRWHFADLNHMTRPADWAEALQGIDAVVNASGALQSGGGDRLDAIQGDSIRALIAACETRGIARFVQISAPGALTADPSAFLSTKALADDRLRGSTLHWAILRPGLVIGRNAYGGTLLLRALAAMPLRLFAVRANSRIQSVALEDVADAVLQCLSADAPKGVDTDLVEREAATLGDLIIAHRRWLGITPAPLIALPAEIAAPISAIADLLGHLGWRSPLRSTAMAMIARNVRGDATGGEQLLGRPLLTLNQILSRHPAGLQDRWQARLVLLTPFIIGALALLFLLSGVTSLMQIDKVAAQLNGTIVAGGTARWLGIGGALADILLGALLLIRRWARSAAIGMAGLTIGYLLMGSWLRPDMWIDPLAPLAKAGTALMLALVAHALLEER